MSGDPECKHLTQREYGDVLYEVTMTGEDDISGEALNEQTWEAAWPRDAEKQKQICKLLAEDGPKAVGQKIAESASEDVDDMTKMAQYWLDKKC
jgi:hypothetical protein